MILKTSKFKSFFRLIKIVGIKKTMRIAAYKLKGDSKDPYKAWMKHNDPTGRELTLQRKTAFPYKPKISVIVPLGEDDIGSLKELTDCMKDQTYTDWELCVQSGSENKDAAAFCECDSRIHYGFSGENSGKAEKLNSALKNATGDYIGILESGDILPADCLFEIVKTVNEDRNIEFIYTDEDKFSALGEGRFDPDFKPDFGIDTLRAQDYIGAFSVFNRDLIEKIGGITAGCGKAWHYDLMLRMSEKAKYIKHIPKILYHKRASGETEADTAADIKAISEHLARVGLGGAVAAGAVPGTYRIDYSLPVEPKVTVLIPNCNQADTLSVCIDSLLKLTTYKNFEIVIIENNSTDPGIFDYYKKIEAENRVKVLYYKEKGFNYSKIINFGVSNTDGEYIVQLNNDTKLLTPDWLTRAVGFCQRADVGCVGAKLYYPDDTVQHAGVVLGMSGVADHLFKGLCRSESGYRDRASHTQNLSAVTAACMVAGRDVYEKAGFMEEKLAVAFNDVDFCLKVINAGMLVVYDPFIEFYHYESKSRGSENTRRKQKRFNGEIAFFINKWDKALKAGDRYYNVNFRLDSGSYKIREEKI